MKVGNFGSCLTTRPIESLVRDFGWEEAFLIHHNRSDVFVDHFVDRSRSQLDFDWLTGFLKPKAETAVDATSFIESQFVPWLGNGKHLRSRVTPASNFPEDIKRMDVDVILLDNFVDVAGCVMHLRENPEKKVFFAANLYENTSEIDEKFVMSAYLTAEESAANWLKIYRYFREIKPDAKIFFICWSPATSRGNGPRTQRILGFYDIFHDLVKGEDLYLIPPVDVPDELTNGRDDWYHVNDKVYKALASYIYLHVVGNLPPNGEKMRHWT